LFDLAQEGRHKLTCRPSCATDPCKAGLVLCERARLGWRRFRRGLFVWNVVLAVFAHGEEHAKFSEREKWSPK
jgi:hypothetical protein